MDTLPPQTLRRWLIHLLAWIAGITLLLSPLAPQAGEKWPEKEIHLVVPWPAGGPSDVMARILAKELSASLGQPVIVENRAGATGTIGARHVARSKADGYTLLFGNTVALVGAVVSSPEPVQFDPVKDFTPIALIAETAYILSAHPSAGIRNYPEFIARARDPAKPPVAVGSTGNGATSDILYDWLIHHQQANLTKIAFKGTAPLVADLIAGHLPVGSAGLSLAQPYYKEGKLHPLVIVGSKRLPELPDVPSARELGLNAPDLTVWDGLFAPAGTPPAILAQLRNAVQKAAGSEELGAFAGKNGSTTVFIAGEAAATRVRKDLAERQQFRDGLPAQRN